ncbi:unnamed protein product [Linum tenue]|uniref:DYW domain-containing protein n=1 Tax=Linum tenue TaxID=586396 RepID=A0AAV0MVG9_9ROSI|nr:unnamed protein product [Linum tenue]
MPLLLLQLRGLLSRKPFLNPCFLYSLGSAFSFSYIPDSTESHYDLLLKSADGLASLRQIHSPLVVSGIVSQSIHLGAQLIAGYAKYGEPTSARSVFDHLIGCRNETSSFLWNTMIRAYANAAGCSYEALELYSLMRRTQVSPNNYTFPFVFRVCASSEAGSLILLGRVVHGEAVRAGFDSDLHVEAALVHMYAKWGEFGDARKVFDEMPVKDLIGVANSILGMYTRCGVVQEARLVFEKMVERNVISWNSMLSGYTQNGQASEALILFDEMNDSNVEANAVTALIMVAACAYLGSLRLGRKFHNFVIDRNFTVDKNLHNALMDMYAKCGDLKTAWEMFNSINPSMRDASSWNVLISGYGMHGHGRETLNMFSRMQAEGVDPNHITFTSVLSACSHAGLVNEGRQCFDEMQKLSVAPEAKHYACVVDMLGRAGKLQEALDLIKQMPFPPNDAVWGALLLACKIHGNKELGQIAADKLFELQPGHTGYYVLMSNIYAASQRWGEVGNLRQYMKNKGMKKPAAFSVIEFGEEIHGFHTADREHPYWEEVYREVEILAVKLKMAGHVPDLSCTLHDMEEEDKELALNLHSEKLAVAFGIMRTESGMTIYLTKNLRVCNDCHSALKFLSHIFDREIVVRDGNRFHHFKGGVCSCNDYW